MMVTSRCIFLLSVHLFHLCSVCVLKMRELLTNKFVVHVMRRVKVLPISDG